MFSHFSKKVFSRAALIAMALSLLSFTVAFAASGDLDATFGDGGMVTTHFSNYTDAAHRMALQSNGRIVLVGYHYKTDFTTSDFTVARYKSNGSLDTSFSGDGKLTTNFGGADQAMDVAIQSDGKIVVSGLKCNSSAIFLCDLAVARYTTNGSPDTTFGSSGKKTVDFGSGNNGSWGGIAIQSDGKIVIAGYMVNSQGDRDFAVYRLKSNGSLDTSFSSDGKASFGFGAGRQDEANDLLLQGSKVVVVGQTCDESGVKCNFAMARLSSSGALDKTFSGDGMQTLNLGADDKAYSVAVQSDGKLVVVGTKKVSNATQYCAVARYTSTGSLDTTFNSNGKKVLSAGFGCGGVIIKSNRIIVSTSISNGENYDFGLFRLKSNGSLDMAFSGDGAAAADFGGDDHAADIALQADGKYVVAGNSNDGAHNDFALARVLP